MKYLLTVAVNKYHTAPLRGCVTDSVKMAECLAKLGFETHSLHDQYATKQGILDKVAEIGEKLQPNDYLVIHYSGHGSQIPCTKGDEADGLTEIICPYDLINMDGSWTNNYITDDDIAQLLSKLDETILVELFMDCCHSGTLTRGISQITPRQVDYPVKNQIAPTVRQFKPTLANVITWSGCQDNQTSADAFIGHEYQGAFTHSLLFHAGLGKTRQETYQMVTNWLMDNDYTQRPNISVQNLPNRDSGLNSPMWSILAGAAKQLTNPADKPKKKGKAKKVAASSASLLKIEDDQPHLESASEQTVDKPEQKKAAGLVQTIMGLFGS